MIEIEYNEYKETIEENMKLIQKNHKLKEEIERLKKETLSHHTKLIIAKGKQKVLEERINKAIEFINDNLYPVGNDVNGSDLPYDEAIQPLVDILRGDKE